MKNTINLGYRAKIRLYSPEQVADHCKLGSDDLKRLNLFLEETIDRSNLIRRHPYDPNTVPYCFQNTPSRLWGEPVLIHKFSVFDERECLREGLRIILRGKYDERNLARLEKIFEARGFPTLRIKLNRDSRFTSKSKRRNYPKIVYGYVAGEESNSGEEISMEEMENPFSRFKPIKVIAPSPDELVLV